MTVFMYLIVTINVLILFFLHRFYIFMSLRKPKLDFEIGMWNVRYLEFILLELRFLNDRTDQATRIKKRSELMERLEKELEETNFYKKKEKNNGNT